ncbi:response regulator [Winogradskyella forsetii]|uniref:response regulator n=1 Tax=Winogradskyella forsetii TaxID=2686077 RepID=UPI0015C1C2FF|nr:response regulator [Winogradskyella forsetii]
MNKVFYIVDDDPIFRKMISIMIHRNDPTAICKPCENGAIGLKKLELEKEQNNNKSIIVLLDINMPVLNGWQFLREIESNAIYDITNLTLYVVSSSTDRVDILKAKQHHKVSDYFHKPLIDGDIRKILKQN